MTHWALPLIGQPWPVHACRSFAGVVLRDRLGVELPDVDTVHASGWRRHDGLARPDDAVLMRGPKGRHIGVWVETPSRVGVLHAHGVVQFETLVTLAEHGYGSFEFWSYAR